MTACLRWTVGLLTGIVLAFPLKIARADSPLTSTPIAEAYGDIPAVSLARQNAIASKSVLQFLRSDAPTDQKAAVVNALGWDINGKDNGDRFVAELAAAKGIALNDLQLKDLSPSDRFVLGYLLAMDDYFDLSPLRPGANDDLWGATPLDLLSQAAYALPQDFTVQFVRAIVEVQPYLQQSWCAVYLTPQGVLERFPAAQRNLRSQAVQVAMDYLKSYAESCEKSPYQAANTTPTAPELNQIYQVGKFQDAIVTANQGGVVLWNPRSRQPITVRQEPLCTTLQVWGDRLWVGCQQRIVQ